MAERIISEKVNKPFEEVKEDSEEENEEVEEQEESLEEEITPDEFNSEFVDFSSDVIAPVLQPTETGNEEQLESELRDIPIPNTRESDREHGIIYNMPDYVASEEQREEDRKKQIMERERPSEIRDISSPMLERERNFDFREFGERNLSPEEEARRNVEEYHEIPKEEFEKREKLPFDRRRKII